MTSTVFIDKTTVIEAPWLNDVNQKTYRTFSTQEFTGTGAQLVFTLSAFPAVPVTVAISGVTQRQSSYTVATNVLTFSEAPPYGTVIEVTV